MSTPLIKPHRPVSIALWVFGSVLAWYLGTFLLGLLVLALSAKQMPEKFLELAMNKYWSYLAWSNLQVLLVAYVPAVLITGLLLLPIIRWSLRRRASKTGPSTRWAIFWRTILCVGLLTAAFSFRTLYTRPWLMASMEEGAWLYQLREHIPHSIRSYFLAPLLTALPWLLAGGAFIYYCSAGIHSLMPQRHPWLRRATLLAVMGSTAAGAWAFPAYLNRINAAPRTDPRPNVLILASDSLRADRLSVNGYNRPTSPAIDALAARSTNFTKCFTPIASTVESMTSMMSGQYPHTTGLQHMFPNRQQVEHVQKNVPQLAAQLRAQGYDTAVMGDWCAGVFDMLPMGFEKVDATTFDNFQVYMSQAVYMSHPVLPLFFDNPIGYWLFPKLESSAFFVTPDVVTERLNDKLARQTHKAQPFFWTVFYSSTHIPYTVGNKNGKLFTDPTYNGPHKHKFDFSIKDWIGSVDLAKKWEEMPKADVDQINGLYDGCVRNFDDNVQSVLAQLKATGLDKNTIILLTSDHGDNLFEPNCTFGHGLTFNGGDQNNNIPCILHVPGQTPKKLDTLTRTIDFAPTLLDLCGAPADPRMEGVSLRPAIHGTTTELGLAFYGETSYLFCRRYIPGEKPAHIGPMDSTTQIDESFDFHFVLKDKYQDDILRTKERVLRTNHWKLVYTPGEGYNIERLYDLINDPHCEINVAAQHPQVFAAMKDKLWLWIREKKETPITGIFPDGEPRPALAPPRS